MNISATLNVFRLCYSPKLALPHITFPTFDKMPVPINIPGYQVKVLVLDKDNCFAYPHDSKVWPAYEKQWEKLKEEYSDGRLLIVSNSAGTNDDPGHQQARVLEESTGVPVLRHSTKKPGCYPEIIEYFQTRKLIDSPKEIGVVGDRLFTDVLMANMMGAAAVWISEGVKLSQSPICRFERYFYSKKNR